ncbi:MULTISPECIES: DJ-1/PfpI family protein [unclassified Pseudodesulfovibrio]|uniref:DJ-1/PfpI family protein n=1 Tax=unclassified Pseudodesulfovibrio TaxID=2661612 RepID=UPI000FEC15C1|nr:MULTISPECIES: DJ-1/PfpI family protein [unclassified Pseudodesulfovibrio]MCJ2165725.1 DJ-1/PfpI family protein [Pseudodesulfovibrio sp. S3-i]RWU02903.1 DJ-1/PfpI family protein [Pseudodesulfovibrio sp. S3]
MRNIIPAVFGFIALLTLVLSVSPNALADAQGKKALLIVAPSDFEPTEYSTTRSTLESGGMTCTVASTKTGSLKSAKGTRAQSDLVLSEVQTGDYDAIVIIGGNGIKRLWMNEDAHRIVREAAEQDKVVAAICAGPGVLAYSGVMQGKKGTAHPKSGAPGALKENGCEYTGNRVEVDNKFITANGPQAAKSFGQAIVAAF